MRAANTPLRDASGGGLLVLDEDGHLEHHRQTDFPRLVEPGDVVVANDAATLPASLTAVHAETGRHIEIRLAGRSSLSPDAITRVTALVLGDGDYRTPTERRSPPPHLRPGDELIVGTVSARVTAVHRHAEVVTMPGPSLLTDLQFEQRPAQIWEAIARHGRPIQYAYVPQPLAIWDTWTAVASRPAAFEPPSAGFILNWTMVNRIRLRGAGFATLTHAAGISSTGRAELDALLPLDEAYEISASTAGAVRGAKDRGGRVIAIGTTVVRSLEHAAREHGRVIAGAGLANNRIGPDTPLQVVDAIVSGIHEAGTSHYDLLRAFQTDAALEQMTHAAENGGYRAHEFGDFVFISRAERSTHRNAEASSPAHDAYSLSAAK
jgi:S-adenosylmethionine:tRNA ribosyltransferase-isomerase